MRLTDEQYARAEEIAAMHGCEITHAAFGKICVQPTARNRPVVGLNEAQAALHEMRDARLPVDGWLISD